jgi:hypothetical protein
MKKVSRRKASEPAISDDSSVVADKNNDSSILSTIDCSPIGDCDSDYDFDQLFEGKVFVSSFSLVLIFLLFLNL